MDKRITREQFEFVSGLARDAAAIVLEPGKEYLVESRLAPLALALGFDSLQAFIERLRFGAEDQSALDRVVEALTTNETLFFRDLHPFDTLENDILPDLLRRRASQRRLAIWSAACSTGQEPFSLAMLIDSKFPQLRDWTVEIIATDLNGSVLEKARSGRFTQLEVNRGLPSHLLAKYFSKQGEHWQIQPRILERVAFQPLNLVRDWPALPSFDLVLMRNVMIYFDVPTKQSVLRKLRHVMRPDGALFLGASETTINLDPNWTIEKRGRSVFYRPASATRLD